MNRRIRFLLGFGGLAVVLLVVFNMWYPPVSEEATTGAVVAVKKHRQQQIAAKDVILGDEATRKSEQVLYGDYLEDAAKLQNVSAELALALRNRQAEDAELGVVRSNLESANRELAAHAEQLQLRAVEAAQRELSAMRALLAAAPAELAMRADIEAQLGRIAQLVENKSTLDSARMEDLSDELASASKMLQSQVLSLAGLEAMTSRLDAVSRNLANREAELASVTAELAAASKLLGRSAAMDAASLEHQAAYLAAMAKENRAIESARRTLDAASKNLGAATKLAAADAQSLEAASRALSSQAADLETLAVANLESRAQLLTFENKAVADLDQSLGAVRKALDNRRASLDAAARQDLELGLRGADAALANRRSDLQDAALASMQIELAAVGRFLDARSKLSNRWAEAGMAANRSDALVGLRSYLGRMSSLGNRAPLATLDQKAQAELAASARALESKAQQLDSASKE